MKTILPRQELQEALVAVSTVTGGRTPRPIVSCVKLTASDETLVLGATDGEIGLRLTVAAVAVEEPGEVVVAADRLLGIVRELSDVELALEAGERECVIRGQGSEFRVFVAAPGEFPPLPEFGDQPDLVVGGAELQRMVGLTLYAAARETTRYAINGVLWEKRGKRLYMVATDGRRLARAGGVLHQAGPEDFDVILPAKALGVLGRVFTPAREQDEWLVGVKVLPNQVMLRSGQRQLSSLLVEGRFPKYQEVIPPAGQRKARVARQEFHAAVRRAALLTTEDSRTVKLAFAADSLVITSRSPEQGEARVELPVTYEGEPLSIGFNPTFLSDALKAMSFEEVCFEMEETFRPAVLSGGDKNEFLYVVMPVSLSS